MEINLGGILEEEEDEDLEEEQEDEKGLEKEFK